MATGFGRYKLLISEKIGSLHEEVQLLFFDYRLLCVVHICSCFLHGC